ncbi:hypothetical protein MIR68_000116 [Amoeboaphelidium protococcarum]|nr:hypothetical protein MIR68_000116 [Amoeboaphelidium protococcarum]
MTETVRSQQRYCYSVVNRQSDGVAVIACQSPLYENQILVMGSNRSVLSTITWQYPSAVQNWPYAITMDWCSEDVFVSGQTGNGDSTNAFVSRIARNGTVLWSTEIFNATTASTVASTVQYSSISRQVLLGGWLTVSRQSPASDLDGFFASVSSDGAVQFIKTFGNAAVNDQVFNAVLYGNTSVALVGVGIASNRAAIWNYGINGTLVWSSSLPIASEYRSVKYYGGYLYSAGSFQGSLGGQTSNNVDFLLTRYSPSQNGIMDSSFVKSWGTSAADYCHDFFYDAASTHYIMVGKQVNGIGATTYVFLETTFGSFQSNSASMGVIAYLNSVALLNDRSIFAVGANDTFTADFGRAGFYVNTNALKPYQASITVSACYSPTMAPTTSVVITTTTTTTSTTTTTTTTSTTTTTASTITTTTTTTASTITPTTTTTTPATTLIIATSSANSISISVVSSSLNTFGLNSTTNLYGSASVDFTTSAYYLYTSSEALISYSTSLSSSLLATSQYYTQSSSVAQTSLVNSSSLSLIASSISLGDDLGLPSSTPLTSSTVQTSHQFHASGDVWHVLSSMELSNTQSPRNGDFGVDSSQSSGSTIMFVLISILIVLFVMFLTLLALYKYHRQRKSRFTSKVRQSISSNTSSLPWYGTSYQNGMTTQITQNTSNSMQTQVATAHVFAIPAFMLARFGIDFRIGDSIAKGGNGTIFQAQVINPLFQSMVDPGVPIVFKSVGRKLTELNEIMRVSFMQELSIMYRFKDDPRFARLYAYTEEPAGILMMHYEFGSLGGYLFKRHESLQLCQFPYSKRQFIYILKLLAQALTLMHANGVAHLDIKPDNALLNIDSEGRLFPVLTDFGISRIIDQQSLKVKAMQISQLKGASLSYACPEILQIFRGTRREDPQMFYLADVYSYSIVLLETMTSKRAYH